MATHGNGPMKDRENFVLYDFRVEDLVNLSYINSLISSKRSMTMAQSDRALKPDLYDYLKPYGVRDRLMLFFQPPHDLDPRIHTDYISKEETHFYSFNILCRGQGTMIWYERPEQGSEMLAHANSPNHIFYEVYPNLDLKKIAEWNSGKVALVRTDIPHGVINDSNELRVCLSVRINNFGWEKAKEIFSTYLKNTLKPKS